MDEIRYDEGKFRELVVLLADRSASDPSFGATKLNKLLFFCDFYAYAYLGEPISGAVYQKLRKGPAPKRLLPVQRELEQEDAVRIVHRQRMIYHQRVTIAQRPPELRSFSAEQLEIVDEVVDLFRHFDAETISLDFRGFRRWRLLMVIGGVRVSGWWSSGVLVPKTRGG